MERIVKIVFYAAVVLAIAYGVMYLIWGDKDAEAGANLGLNVSYILMGIGAAGILVASAFNLIHHPKSGIRVLIGLAVFGIIVFMGYSMSSGEVLESYYNYGVDTVKQSKFIDAELFLMYGLGVLAILAIVASEINAAIKKA